MGEEMFVVVECNDDDEYDQMMSVLAQFNELPYTIVDDVSQLCSCSKSEMVDAASIVYDYNRATYAENVIPLEAPYSLLGGNSGTDSFNVAISSCKQTKEEANESNSSIAACPPDRKRKSFNNLPESPEKRKKRLLPQKFHEFLLEMLMSPKNSHLIHFSGTVDRQKKNGLQFTIPNRKIFADVWGKQRGLENYSHISLVNKDLWNATQAGIVSRVLFRDPLLIYRFEPAAFGRFDKTLKELRISMQDVFDYAADFVQKH